MDRVPKPPFTWETEYPETILNPGRLAIRTRMKWKMDAAVFTTKLKRTYDMPGSHSTETSWGRVLLGCRTLTSPDELRIPEHYLTCGSRLSDCFCYELLTQYIGQILKNQSCIKRFSTVPTSLKKHNGPRAEMLLHLREWASQYIT